MNSASFYRMAVGLILAGLVPMDVARAESGDGFYAGVRAGITAAETMRFAQPGTANLTLNPDEGWVFEGALGYHFTSYLRGEVSVSYGQANVSAAFQENVLPFVACGTFPSTPCLDPEGNGDLESLSGFGTAYFDIPLAGWVRPYLGAGVGFMRVNADVGTRATVGNAPVGRFAILDATDTVVAYRGTAGVSFDMEFADFDIAYHYTFSDKPSIPGRGTLVNFTFNRRFNIHSLTAGVKFRFF